MTENIKSLYNWFDINRDSIIENHSGENVLISDNQVLGYFTDEESALNFADENGLQEGTFLIQWCITQPQEINMFYNVAVNYV